MLRLFLSWAKNNVPISGDLSEAYFRETVYLHSNPLASYCKEVNGTETLNYAVFKSSVKVKTLKIIRNMRELQWQCISQQPVLIHSTEAQL